MTIEAVRYTADQVVAATIDGVEWSNVRLDGDGHLAQQVQAWIAAGHVPEPYVAPAPPPPAFLARDLLALLTPDDYAAIQAAVAGSAALGLLWAGLLGQGDAPIGTDSARFQQGWAGLAQALGPTRAAELAAALGFSSP